MKIAYTVAVDGAARSTAIFQKTFRLAQQLPHAFAVLQRCGTVFHPRSVMHRARLRDTKLGDTLFFWLTILA